MPDFSTYVFESNIFAIGEYLQPYLMGCPPDVCGIDAEDSVPHAESARVCGRPSWNDFGDEDSGLTSAEGNAGVVIATDDAQPQGATGLDQGHVLNQGLGPVDVCQAHSLTQFSSLLCQRTVFFDQHF